MLGESLTLGWNGHSLGVITGVKWLDFPWCEGEFAAAEWPAELRVAAELLAEQVRTDSDLTDPPEAGLFDGWTVTGRDGMVRNISVPVVDFLRGRIEWR